MYRIYIDYSFLTTPICFSLITTPLLSQSLSQIHAFWVCAITHLV